VVNCRKRRFGKISFGNAGVDRAAPNGEISGDFAKNYSRLTEDRHARGTDWSQMPGCSDAENVRKRRKKNRAAEARPEIGAGHRGRLF
jgi:hypothetical protein